MADDSTDMSVLASHLANGILRGGSIEEELKARARILAEPTRFESSTSLDTGRHVVCFRAGESRYGVELGQLREIRNVESIASIPCTPRFILGLVQVHGDITAVIDLVTFFGFKRTEPLPRPTTTLVVEHNRRALGIAADELLDVRIVRHEDIMPMPITVRQTEREITRGVTPEKILILDGEALVNHPRLRVGSA